MFLIFFWTFLIVRSIRRNTPHPQFSWTWKNGTSFQDPSQGLLFFGFSLGNFVRDLLWSWIEILLVVSQVTCINKDHVKQNCVQKFGTFCATVCAKVSTDLCKNSRLRSARTVGMDTSGPPVPARKPLFLRPERCHKLLLNFLLSLLLALLLALSRKSVKTFAHIFGQRGPFFARNFC